MTPREIAARLGLTIVVDDDHLAPIHEAGHVIVARLCGVPVAEACVYGGEGHTRFVDESVVDVGPSTRVAYRIHPHTRALIHLGGCAAEVDSLGSITLGCLDDLRQAWAALDCYPAKERFRILDHLFDQAHALVEENHGAVAALADELDEDECCLAEEEIEELLEDC